VLRAGGTVPQPVEKGTSSLALPPLLVGSHYPAPPSCLQEIGYITFCEPCSPGLRISQASKEVRLGGCNPFFWCLRSAVRFPRAKGPDRILGTYGKCGLMGVCHEGYVWCWVVCAGI